MLRTPRWRGPVFRGNVGWEAGRANPARRSVGVRALRGILVAAACLAACQTGGSVAGTSFARSGLFAPVSDEEEAHDALLRADIGRADSVAQLGYVGGLGTMFTDDVVFLRGGLPIIRGRSAALAIASAESVSSASTVRWQPVRAATSADGGSGYSYGYTIISTPTPTAAPLVRIDRYIAFWRREEHGWRIAAYAETYGSPPPALALPPGAEHAVLRDQPMSRARGALEAMRAADTAFSRDAALRGTGRAFAAFAASDAQVFSGPGEFISGPDAIMDSFGPASRDNSLVWHPLLGEVARSGDLGFTVGNAVFTGKREDGAPLVRHSKYLTVWKRQRDGEWRFVVDGGSARPDA